MELSHWQDNTTIELNIASGYEDAAWIPEDRLPAQTPSAKSLRSRLRAT